MNIATLVFFAAAVLCAFVACTGRDDRRPTIKQYTFDETPEELAPYRDKARQGFQSVANRLIPRLTAALAEGGPEEGVKVCSGVAQELTEEGAAEAGFKLGRTSHKLRNPANTAPEWLTAMVTESAGKTGAEVKPMVFDLGNRVGVASPIVLAGMCVQCHGTEDEITAETRDILKQKYPDDQAVGFKPGELRGWFWAEVPKN